MLLKQQIRYFHNTIASLARGVGRRSNPGVGFRLSTVEDVEQDFLDDPEGLEEMESDFMSVNKTHREHEREVMQRREHIRHQMVKHKYFREPKLPNLLTYAEKEQIRMLHARDPEEWSIERLAESFPATQEIIQKIILAKWQARSTERVRKHDELVIQNWEKLRADPKSLQLTPHLIEHIQKFSTRRTEDLRALASELPAKPALPRPQKQKFLSIITSCNKYAEEHDVPQLASGQNRFSEHVPSAEAAENETYLLETVRDKRRMRLQELKKYKLSASDLAVSASSSSSSGNPFREDEASSALEKHTVSTIQNPSGTGIISNNVLTSMNLPEKYESSEIVISAADQRRFEITRVKDRIHIPRKLRRKGATYRVEDAYYDDDGEFLYRVPGMGGRSK